MLAVLCPVLAHAQVPDCPACKSHALEIVRLHSAEVAWCWCAVCAKTCWMNLRTGDQLQRP